MIRGLMSDEEWACLEPFVIERGARSGRRPRDHRLVLDGIFWIARTGVAWRDLHEHFGKWSSVYRQFRRWTLSGLWELLFEAFNDSGGGNPSLQMIDSTIIRAHHCSAGAKGGLRVRVPSTARLRQALRTGLAVQKVALRPRSISASMRWDCP
jgi:transposase